MLVFQLFPIRFLHDFVRRAFAFESLIRIGGIRFSCRTLVAVSPLETMPQEHSATCNRHEYYRSRFGNRRDNCGNIRRTL